MAESFELIVTLNPSYLGGETLNRFADSGVSIFRLNGSFLLTSGAEEIAGIVREKCRDNVKILLDLPGFKPRFSHINEKIPFEADTPITVGLASFNFPDIVRHMEKGDSIRINDGMVRLKIEAINDHDMVFVPDRPGVLRRGKGFHLEKNGFRPSLNCLSQLDQDLIEVAKRAGIDFVGLSFVHNLGDIEHVKTHISGSGTGFIPKIEARESLEWSNLMSILTACDTVIIDRGDMSGEVGLENVWYNQRKIIDLAKLVGCRVIMATQFFTNMVRSPLPSIAEVDSFYDLLNCGIDGIQVSEETCVGHHGFEVVQFIAESFERIRKHADRRTAAKGRVIWILGPTSSGKTTLGKALTERLMLSKIPVTHLDGDEVRGLIGKALSFGPEDRLVVVKNLTHHANKAVRAGNNVIVSALTAGDDAREYIRNNIEDLTVVYLECPIKECIRRDSRGLYSRAIRGEIDTVIGFNSPYKVPDEKDITVHTGEMSLDESVNILLRYLVRDKRIRYWGDGDN